ncbi:MAG: ABC transporter permease [Vicinamibacterales bacterium]
MWTLVAVAHKELRQIMRDRRTLLILLFVPAMFLLLYGYALNFDIRNIRLAVEDRDGSRQSRELISAFVNSGYFHYEAAVTSEHEIDTLVNHNEARAVLVIPEHYGRSVMNHQPVTVQVIIDGDNANTASTVMGYVQMIVAETSAEYESMITAGAMAPATMPAGSTDVSTEESVKSVDALPSVPSVPSVAPLLSQSSSVESVKSVDALPPGPSVQSVPSVAPVALEARVWYNPQLRSTLFLVPGLIAYISMITAVISTALSVVREKERGTMEQVRMAPVRPGIYILGKTIPYLVISFISALVIILVAMALFDLPMRGSWLLLCGSIGLFLIGAQAQGLFISTVAPNQQVAFQVALLSSFLPTFILSGFIFPISSMPTAVQVVTYIVPARYFLVALRAVVLKGAPVAAFWPDLMALVIFATVALGLASVRLSREWA